jgi:hypothetical protein
MASEKSVGRLIDEFEAAGKLSAPDAQALRQAPIWTIPFTEIAAYLGGSVVFVGLVWIIIALLQDMSKTAIDTALFITSALTGGLSYWLVRQGEWQKTLGEFVIAISTVSFAIGLGLLLDIADVQEDLILLFASASALAIGTALVPRTIFIGTVIVVVATQPFIAAVVSKYFADTALAPLAFMISGTVLLWFARQKIGLQFIARSAGAVSLLCAAIGYAAWENNRWQPAIALLITSLLFAYGAKIFHLEVVGAGGLGVTITTGILAGQLFDSSLAQGIAVIGAGLIIVTLAITISRRSTPIS